MMIDKKLETMAMVFQEWLDWQEQKYSSEGISIDDNTHIYKPPVYPSRGTVKAWITALEEASELIKKAEKGEI